MTPLSTLRKQRVILLMAGLLILGFVATSLTSFLVSRQTIRDSILSHELR